MLRSTVGGPATPVDIIKDSSGYLAQMAALITGIAATAPSALGVNHIPKFTGELYYVDGDDGNDANDGLLPNSAMATMTAGIALMVAGDALTVKAGIYDEPGLELALDGMELWCEIGVHIRDSTPGTALLVTGDHCRIHGPHFDQATAIALQIVGDEGCYEDINVNDVSVGFVVTSDYNLFARCRTILATTTGFQVHGEGNVLAECSSLGDGSGTRGFHMNGTGDRNQLIRCVSVGNDIAGFSFEAGSDFNIAQHCISGSGDGDVLDAGVDNFLDILEHMPSEYSENVYPISDGEGSVDDPIAITTDADDETNGPASTMNYWGEPYVIIPPGEIAIRYHSVGVSLFAATTGKDFRATMIKIDNSKSSAKVGGNTWDEGETALTVVDGTLFEAGDFVWIYSAYKPNGEIVRVFSSVANVVTIIREGSQFGAPNTGLRWNHTTNDPGTEMMYLVFREMLLASRSLSFDFSAGSARDHETMRWGSAKLLDVHDGLLVRVMNATDSLNGAGFSVAAIYN